MEVKLRGDVRELLGDLSLADKQVRFAAAVALTKTAKAIQAAEVAEIRTAFDRPTPYTLGSVFVKSATAQQLKARVWLKDDAGKGTPAWKYLAPQIEGGDRRLKRFERGLERIGVLPSGMFIVPGAGAQLDQYGNVKGSFVAQIMSYFGAMGEQGYKANMSSKGRARLAKDRGGKRGIAYFAIRARRGRLAPGIYSRTQFALGSAVKPVFIFVRKPSYKQRWNFYGIADQVADATFVGEFEQAYARARATAR